MQNTTKTLLLLILIGMFATTATLADSEFTGAFEPKLVVNTEDMDDVIFKPVKDISKLNFEVAPDMDETTVTATRIYNPMQDKNNILAALIEVEDEKPAVYVDVNMDGLFSKSELVTMKRQIKDNPYLWQATVEVSFSGKFFKSYPIYLQYFRTYRYDDMAENECLVKQSKDAFAKGIVDINGKPTIVIYGYNPASKKISLTSGWLGVDSDGDGEVYVDRLSSEVAKADEESVIFRAGQTFVSTKKVDVEKNLITMREHKPSDYKRIDLKVGEVLPDFNFTDFKGKKRKFSEFKGKYVLLDIWGLWCPPCRRELPYLKAAYTRFQARNFEILALNTDTDFTIESINSNLQKNGMTWTQAELPSIINLIKSYRVSSFPTTMLIGPDGKIISLNQTDKGQLDLRGKDLLKTLDDLLPF
jgi:thiol-disulfide isomerase/thioredoxin